MRRTFLRAGLLVAALAAAGCSEFNMTPSCTDAGGEIAIAMIPNSLVPPGGQIDKARVRSLVTVSDLTEVAGGYNERTCRGRFATSDGALQVVSNVRLQQAEGARSWQEITFLDADKPDFQALAARVVSAYAGVGP